MSSESFVARGNGTGYLSDADGRVCMVRCFECGRENYVMAVSSGYCAWCGYNANEGE